MKERRTEEMENSSEGIILTHEPKLEAPVIIARPNLQSSRSIQEMGLSRRTFAAREVAFSGEFGDERSRQAFEDYKFIRNLRDKTLRRAKLEEQLVLCRKNGASRDIKNIECAIRGLETAYDPRGGEVIFECRDLEDARLRVLELVGPSDPDSRTYRYCRLGDAKEIVNSGGKGPINGFESVANFESHGARQRFSRSWRIDYDSRKGPHFNVMVRPMSIYSGIDHFLHNNDPESLNIALVFPGDKRTYDNYLHDVEISAITSIVNGEGDALGYLPLAVNK